MSPSQSRGAAAARPVRLLAAGGTISMQGEHAVPTLDAAALVAAIPELERFPSLEAENVLGLPGPQISLEQGLGLVRQAGAAAARGDGVVITTGTDTLEELAMLGAMTYGGDAPIVFTGANRPASAPGADGPANLLDAVALAASPDGAGLGAVVVFGGEILAATSARKVES
ncbi:MAG: asparaginase, partial [Solirubrobacteraceae bacterium]